MAPRARPAAARRSSRCVNGTTTRGVPLLAHPPHSLIPPLTAPIFSAAAAVGGVASYAALDFEALVRGGGVRDFLASVAAETGFANLPTGGSGAGGAAAAAASASPTFEELLVEGGLRRANLSCGALRRARIKYANSILLAAHERNATLAVDVYEAAARLPSTSTQLQLSIAGYRMNGPLFDLSELTICYKGERVYVLKCLDPNEAARIATFCEACASALPLGITPFEIMDSPGHKVVMIMPKFATTLEPVPYLSEDGVLGFWNRVRNALNSLHALGFAHMDVKPSNICFNEAGEMFLIDLGSISRFGEVSSSTDAYVPHDFGSRRAHASLDWWMLAMTLAEKACGTEHGLPVGVGARSATKAELQGHLETYLDRRVWTALEPMLVK